MGTDATGAPLVPSEVVAELLAGNRRFVRGETRHDRPGPRHGRDRLPGTAVIACMDGRVPIEAAFDQPTGAVCAIRSAGHVLDRAALGSLELAVTVLGVKAVLVLGHLQCAAVQAAITAERAGRGRGGAAGYVLEQIAPAVREAGDGATDAEVVRAHVRRTVAAVRQSAHLPGGDEQAVAGAVYDIDTGRIALLD